MNEEGSKTETGLASFVRKIPSLFVSHVCIKNRNHSNEMNAFLIKNRELN